MANCATYFGDREGQVFDCQNWRDPSKQTAPGVLLVEPSHPQGFSVIQRHLFLSIAVPSEKPPLSTGVRDSVEEIFEPGCQQGKEKDVDLSVSTATGFSNAQWPLS